MKNRPQYNKGHKITGVDPEARTANCCICGPTQIVKSAFTKGKQYYRCLNAFERLTTRATYAKKHFLSDINPETQTGTCSECGTVYLYKRVIKGTGEISWCCSISSIQASKRVAARKKIGKPVRKTHTLCQVNTENKTAVCSICGPVSIVCRDSKMDPSSVNYWRCTGSTRATQLKVRYGLVEDEYKAMESKCGGRCQICGKKPNSGKLHVDHEHATGEGKVATVGKVRGLLCGNCNAAIGHFKDDSARIEAALRYLQPHDEAPASCH